MEDVRGRWVVHDDDFAELAAQPAEVFDVVSSVENAGFPEKPGAKHPPLVQQVRHRVSILMEQQTTRLTQPVQRHYCRHCCVRMCQWTLAKLAVKRTHSKSSPIFWRNSSTWGLFSTYTWNIDRISTLSFPFNTLKLNQASQLPYLYISFYKLWTRICWGSTISLQFGRCTLELIKHNHTYQSLIRSWNAALCDWRSMHAVEPRLYNI